jgi:hypothetical protein
MTEYYQSKQLNKSPKRKSLKAEKDFVKKYATKCLTQQVAKDEIFHEKRKKNVSIYNQIQHQSRHP